MIRSLFVLFTLNLSFSFGTLANAKTNSIYDRNCDQKIGVQNYLVAGSMDNESPGGKTYNFTKIVNALKSELLGSSNPDSKRAECLNSLFNKASSDAEQYWFDRITSGGCLSPDGSMPSVKPDSCSQGTWDEYHRSLAHIQSSEQLRNQIKKTCEDSKNGKSCTKAAGVAEAQKTSKEIASAAMDSCCETKEGPAFRVLKSSYTVVAFGQSTKNISDAEVQKECLVRTRPGQKSSGIGNTIANCAKGVANALISAIYKLLSSAKNLTEVIFATDAVKVIGKKIMDPPDGWMDIASKIGNLMEEIGKQLAAEAYTGFECFQGDYKTEQICKFAGGIITDFFIGKGLAVGISKLGKLLSGGASSASSLAKEMLAGSATAQKLKDVAKVAATRTQTAARSSAAGKVMTSGAARSAQIAKNIFKSNGPSFSQRMSGRLKEWSKKKEPIDRSREPELNSTPSPNAQVAMPAAPATATTQTTGLASNSANVGTRAASGAGTRTVSTAGRSAAQNATTSSSRAPKVRLTQRETQDLAQLTKYKNQPGGSRLPIPKNGSPTSKMDRVTATVQSKKDKLNQLLSKNAIDKSFYDDVVRRLDDDVLAARKSLGLAAPASASISATSVASATDGTAVAVTRTTSGSQFPSSVDFIDDTAKIPTGTNLANKTIDPADLPTPNPATTANSGVGIGSSSGTSTAGSTLSQGPLSNFSWTRYSDFDLSATLNAGAKLEGPSQSAWGRLSNFIQSAKAKAANQDINTMNSVYQSRRNWGVRWETVKRHQDVEKLFKAGHITPERAESLHNIIRATEEAALKARATSYSTQYITAPNTNPTKFSKSDTKWDATKKVVSGGLAGSTQVQVGTAMSVRDFNSRVDSSVDEDTANAAVEVFQKIEDDPESVASRFAGIKKESDARDTADALIIKIKIAEEHSNKHGMGITSEQVQSAIDRVNAELAETLKRINEGF